MANIQKRQRKDGTVYRVQVRIKGYPQQQKSFRRLTDAKLWAQQTEAALRRGELRALVKVSGTHTLAEAIKRYRNEVLPRKSPGTQRSESAHMDFWEAKLGDYGLTYIEPAMIAEHLATLANEKVAPKHKETEKGSKAGAKATKPPKLRSLRTIKYYRDTLSTLFKYARQWQWATHNPLDDVEKITNLRNGRVRYLSDDERKALLAACKSNHNRHLYPIVMLALTTGARKGEVLGLTIGDVDLNRGMAVLRDTKNGETRSVPIVPQITDLMREQAAYATKLYESLEDHTGACWLFPRTDGKEPIEIRKAWYNAVDAAKLADFRFHDLRHSTASYLAMNGASLVEIADVLGHKTLQMVKRYSHLSESHVKGLMERVNTQVLGPPS